jgi:superfamily II DNA or RNA helicase
LKLRPYQEEGLSKIPAEGRCIIAWPTGAGKTVGFAKLAENRGGRTLVLAHRDELISQAVEKISQIWRGADVGVCKAERNELDHQVVVASVQTLSRENRLAQIGKAWTTCIVDETHHATEPTYRRVIDACGAPLTVGFTATPYRTDGKRLEEVFPQGIVHEKSILWMIQQGYLCDLRATQISLNVDLRGVRVRGGDFSEEDLGKAFKGSGAAESIAQAYVENASPKKAVCFTASVAQAHEVSEKLVGMGVPAAAVWGEQDIAERRQVLRRFSEGTLQVLTNCAVLTEGYDEPSIECIIMARPTLSKLFYTQCIGRGTRLYPGKSECLILDMRPQTDREPESMASMFGITERAAEAGIEALLASSDEVAGFIDTDFTDFHRAPAGRLHWVPDGRRFLLSLGDATLALVPAGLTWEIKEFGRAREVPTKKLYSGLSLDYAQGVAEDLVRGSGAWGLASEGAHWRMGPPSEAQLRIFADKGWGTPRSKGAAADRMTVEFNRRRA